MRAVERQQTRLDSQLDGMPVPIRLNFDDAEDTGSTPAITIQELVVDDSSHSTCVNSKSISTQTSLTGPVVLASTTSSTLELGRNRQGTRKEWMMSGGFSSLSQRLLNNFGHINPMLGLPLDGVVSSTHTPERASAGGVSFDRVGTGQSVLDGLPSPILNDVMVSWIKS